MKTGKSNFWSLIIIVVTFKRLKEHLAVNHGNQNKSIGILGCDWGFVYIPRASSILPEM